MIPKRPFYFLRHGQTDWNLERRYQGHSDVPLNGTGIAQARAAAECLACIPINRIVASPLIRAVATAAIVAEKLQKPIHIERGLIERNFGSFCGLVIHEVKAQHGLRTDQSSRDILPPDADPFHEIFDRIPPVVARWMTSHSNELLLFVGHSGVFDALHHHMLGPRSGSESYHAIPYLANPTRDGWELTPLALVNVHSSDTAHTTISRSTSTCGANRWPREPMSVAPVNIRPALRSDLPQLLALYPYLNPADAIPPLNVAERRFDDLRKYEGSEIFVGFVEDAIVTSCTLIVIPNLTRGGEPYGLIENVVTHAAYRGRGFGKQLLQAAVAAAWQADCYKVMLMTGSKKPSTLAFYVAAGFEQTKTGFQVRRRS